MPVRLLRAGSAPKGDSAGKLRNLGVALCLLLGCLSLQKVPANADINAIDAYKIYAHIKSLSVLRSYGLKKVIGDLKLKTLTLQLMAYHNC